MVPTLATDQNSSSTAFNLTNDVPLTVETFITLDHLGIFAFHSLKVAWCCALTLSILIGTSSSNNVFAVCQQGKAADVSMRTKVDQILRGRSSMARLGQGVVQDQERNSILARTTNIPWHQAWLIHCVSRFTNKSSTETTCFGC